MWQYRGFVLPQDLKMLVRIIYLTFFFTFLLKRKAFWKILERFPRRFQEQNMEPVHDQQDYILLDKVWRGATFMLCHVLRTKKPCLRRTLILYHWFCNSSLGIKASVGICKEGNILKSHAWLIVNGVPFRENLKELDKYSPILEW